MQVSATVLHQRIRALLFEDPVISACGFTHRMIGQKATEPGPYITLTWSDLWFESVSGLLGTVTIDVAGVDERTREAVLERVALIVQAAPAQSGTIRQVRPDGGIAAGDVPNRFMVLASSPGDETRRSAAFTRDRRSEQARDLVFLALAEDDELAEMGYRYDTIRMHLSPDPPPATADGTDTLLLTWTELDSAADGAVRQRLQVSVDGPWARFSDSHLRRALICTGTTLLRVGGDLHPIDSITVATPRIRRCVGHELVTVGFDVTIS